MPSSVNRSNTPLLCLLVVAVIALGSAYGSQYFGGLQPCKLCLYQRWPWWTIFSLAGLTPVLPVSVEMTNRMLILIGIVLIVGCAIAFYQTGIEQKWWPGPATCSGVEELPKTLSELHLNLQRSTPTRCDKIPWSFMGVSMAGYNAIASGTTSIFALVIGLKRN